MSVNKCAKCANCKQLYFKYLCKFNFCGKYYCTALDKIIDKNKTDCLIWEKRKVYYDLSCERFDDAEKDIAEISKYFSK